MGAGRVVCVALPFGLTLASLLCIILTLLAGVTNKNLEMFDVNTENMSISSSDLQNLVNLVTKRDALPEPDNLGAGALTSAALNNVLTSTTNFTASDFGLADSYKVYLWNYCSTANSSTTCTKAKFNWASSALNVTYLNERASAISIAASGNNATLPDDITTALKAYIHVSKWTQIVYSIALLFSVLTLVTGLFGFCSRVGSCITYLMCGLATTTIIAASAMATASSAIVVGAIQGTSSSYGITASIKTPFLSLTWFAVAFSIGAGLFWSFSICCCKAQHRSKGNNEKFVPSTYQPLHDPNMSYQSQTQGVYNPQAHVPARGAGYEPYKQSAV
ncbi:SUR7 protein-like protein [Calycina marina]|uniref:SUR7 protein-like protein n=1 Tax=Calycina marina TaxID=1763456 RepID=A0A9P7YVU4_9HELO|nr:SUR7 protein-like protein [Calycina marina]